MKRCVKNEIMKNILIIALGLMMFSCQDKGEKADAYGNFFTTDIVVSSQANGEIIWMDVEEGLNLSKGALVAIVDTSSLVLQKVQLDAKMKAIRAKTQDPQPQIDVLEEQKRKLNTEKDRLQKLIQAKAATDKQLDDITAQIKVVDRQIDAAKRNAKRANSGILSEIEPVKAQLKVLNNQISKCYIHNPESGTVLTKIAHEGEVTAFGRPLYRIAPMDTMELRVYISETQLADFQLGQSITVKTDNADGSMHEQEARISWIASEAEFTPAAIQTKEERVNLVYAIKLKVPNKDGRYKIGMPAEVWK